MSEKKKQVGFYTADILLPQNCDMGKWSVVACDQYTSEPKYWEEVENFVGQAPSTLRLTLPEIYLGGPEEEKRTAAINASMSGYLQNNVFRTVRDSFVYVERTHKHGRVRRGLVGAVDLEEYDYNRGASSLIRATEGTVLERIPPRVRVRKNAPLELPHVMVLIDDPDAGVVEPLAEEKGGFEKLYDFELMQESGHIAGYAVSGARAAAVSNSLEKLLDPAAFAAKYGVSGKPVMAYAVGDGNHSLATAKRCWEDRKAALLPEEAENDPARYALVELVNIHDASLEFEPIHRVVFDVEPERLLSAFFEYYPAAKQGEPNAHRVEYVYAGGDGARVSLCPECGLAVGMLQNFLDGYIRENGGRVDYIHGEDVVRSLGTQPGAIGFLLPPMGKSELFRAVITDGVLPRKTFSMGEACDKRFYLESRAIR